MKFVCRVSSGPPQDPWDEIYDKPEITTIEEAILWAKRTIAMFNASLRPNEKMRTLLDVDQSFAKDCDSPHTWGKTSLVTQTACGLTFDAMRCKVCGITAKRYGLGLGSIVLDAQYRRVRSFLSCSKSTELLRKRKENLASLGQKKRGE